jgi:hypothetical protein
MTYSNKVTHKCGVVGCNEPAVVVIPKYRDVSSMNTDGILHVQNTCWCKSHAPMAPSKRAALRYGLCVTPNGQT